LDFNACFFLSPSKCTLTLLSEESALNVANNYVIRIFDLQGKLVQSRSTNSLNNYEIDVKQLPAGVYNLNIVAGDWTKNIKFVKQ
jgi:hypothetical protein